MYTVLSYLPPVLTKTPFARYVKKHIFDPLGMTSTTYSFAVANASGQLADGLTRQNGTVRAFPYWNLGRRWQQYAATNSSLIETNPHK